jgi:putative flippase GtrA
MTAILKNPRERTRFIKFAVVGIIGAVIDFGTFNLLSTALHIPPVWASVVSFIAAVISNFIWNRYWTYPDSRSKPIYRQLVQFGMINLIGLAIRTPIFATLEKPFAVLFASLGSSFFSPFQATILGHNLALAIAVIIVMFWNFFVNRYLTYNDVE